MKRSMKSASSEENASPEERAIKTEVVSSGELRWLCEIAKLAADYRTATCAAFAGVRMNQDDTEGAYDRAASKLDGALNELRIAREENVS